MATIANLADWLWHYGVMFLLVLTVVVFIHELGHFLVARWCGVAVKAFSIGFGPEIWGFNDRHGTRWRFAWIPLGGYVKFVDDENAASQPTKPRSELTAAERAGSFHEKPVWQRAAVVAAGPIANFILSIAIFAAVYSFYGVRMMPAYIEKVVPGSAAEAGGFKAGDKVVSVAGQPIDRFEDLQQIVSGNAGVELAFTVERDGQQVQLKAVPKTSEERDIMGRTFRRGLLGIQRSASPDQVVTLHPNPLEAIGRGVKDTYETITRSLAGLRDIITQRQSVEQMGGPLMLAEVTAKVAQLGLEPMLLWIAFISANIGFLNLLPIPVLDGGHLLFYGIEAVRRRPLDERVQQFGFQLGLGVLLTLMALAFYNDVGSILRRAFGVD